MAKKMKTNSLRFTDNRVAKDGKQWTIEIRLNDACHNGHQDFAITGACYEAGKRKIDKNCIRFGVCGDEIAENFPEYAIFNKLHMCDYLGIPMSCASSGFYFLQHGFEHYKSGETLKSKFCKEYRINGKQYDILSTAQSPVHMAILLEQNGIFEQWKEEADKAIKQLEELTGNEFVVDSVKTQYDKPTDEEKETELNKIKSGYYSAESEAKRAKEVEAKELHNIDDEENKKIEKIKLEYKIKRIMFSAGKKVYNNYIFYNHNNTIAFNWRTFDDNKLSDEEIQKAKDLLSGKMPSGVTFR